MDLKSKGYIVLSIIGYQIKLKIVKKYGKLIFNKSINECFF